MPTLTWIGKEAVENHHHEVPFHLLKDVPELACGDPGSGNLIVQGDNLLALKALLPYYAGQVKCIYIDPPYNTGNEGWVYNDNVSSPTIREWLGRAVGGEAEDLSRHDKWLCMMYPRLALLRQFLREDGAIFVNLDDTEAASCRLLMDELFGVGNRLAVIAWEKRYTRSNNARLFYSLKDTLLVYRKSPALDFLREPRTEKADSIYKNPDQDPRGPWTSASYVNPATKEMRPNLVYTITNPTTGARVDHPTHAWKFEPETHEEHVREDRLWWGKNGNAKYPRLKVFPKPKNGGLVPIDVWRHDDSGTTDEGGAELKGIFGTAVFDNPKPTRLLVRVLQLACTRDGLVMDCFAGSGTTGHAVQLLNQEDEGKRHFILVEMESEIARNTTAERIRRAAEGYTDVKGKDFPGLGGGFRFAELGDPLFDETGRIRDSVPFADLARHVYFTETGEPLPPLEKPDSPLLGVCRGLGVYLLYNGILGDNDPSGGNILTRPVLAGLPPHDGLKVIYANGCLLGPEILRRQHIVFKQTPYEIKVS